MTSLNRRSLLAGSAAAGVAALAGPARAQETPGVTATELKIGCTTSLSGPVSALGTIARCSDAYFKMVNDQGGIAGRKINFIFYDDAFNPAKTAEQTRKLTESDNVAFLFSMLGTSPNSAVVKYINANKVPHLFLSVNGDKWGDYQTYPWTTGFAPSSRTEAQIFAKYALSQKPDAKFALLYQNDDLGKDFVNGLRDVAGRAIRLPGQGGVLRSDRSHGRFPDRYPACQRRRRPDIRRHRTVRRTGDPQGVRAGLEADVFRHQRRVVGIVNDHAGRAGARAGPDHLDLHQGPLRSGMGEDAGMKDYFAFMAKCYGDGNPKEALNAYGYTVTSVLKKLLEQCNGKFSRDSIMAQADSLKNLEVPTLLPGVRVNTSPTNHHPLRQMQLQRWDGKGYVRFGSIIEGANL